MKLEVYKTIIRALIIKITKSYMRDSAALKD